MYVGLILICLYWTPILTKHVDLPIDNGRIDCEPLLNKSSKYWVNRFNMTKAVNFTVRIFHSSKEIYHIPPSLLQLSVGMDKTYRHQHGVEIKQTGTLLPIRKLKYLLLWTYIYGDAVVFHQFNSQTKEYHKEEIGFHTNKFFAIEHPSNWGAIEFVDHTKPSYVVLGWTFVSLPPLPVEIEFAKLDDMLAEFPNHKEVIHKLFDRNK